jgi:ubiquinone/menaquinone biosynthesis C-methylase UbiE
MGMVITPANDVLGGYNELADFYERHWSGHYHPWALDIYERLLFRHLRQGARVLDVCCGNGVVVAALQARGFDAVGVDASAGMLSIARRRAPDAQLLLNDARNFILDVTGRCRRIDVRQPQLSPDTRGSRIRILQRGAQPRSARSLRI